MTGLDCWPATPSGTISPWLLRTLSSLDVLDLVAELRIGLHDDLPGAAERLKSLTYSEPEIDLQRAEDSRSG